MRVRNTEKVPIKMWLEYLEDGALQQAKNAANLPFIFKHLAIMPDSHQGYGVPIGSVLATRGYVIPFAVGVDIGCGMCALKTDLDGLPTETLKAIMGKTREKIPVGRQHQAEPQSMQFMPVSNNCGPVVKQEFGPARGQIGTLGGGNHFIEIQKDQDGAIWIMIHSGSRNIGKKVCDYYDALAKKLNREWCSSVPPSQDLAFLPLDGLGRSYLDEMNFCVEFALANRKLMMRRVLESFYEVLQRPLTEDWNESLINIAHNYAAMENHYGENVMVHRKGATRAREGEIGIIPGSQGSHSYIVEGLGNPESFQSCSHGAGRKMGRKEACRSLDLKAQQKLLDDQGIIHSVNKVEDLDEAPGVYKDISQVMADQIDLVKATVELTPLGVIKG